MNSISTSLTLICLFMCNFFNMFYTSSSANEINYNLDEDSSSPIVENISPGKCDEFIIANPTIKIYYSDKSGIDTNSIKLFVNYKDVTKDATISKNKIVYTPLKALERGPQIIKFSVSDLSNNCNNTSLEWYFTVGSPTYNHYRGLLHSHTSASDGSGTCSDAYYLARDKSNLDFFAITEHSHMLDNHSLATLLDGGMSKKWCESVKYKNTFTLNDKFIPLNGFEISFKSKESKSLGHINIFNSTGFVTKGYKNMNLEDFYKYIYDYDELIGQFNHPGKKFGNFENFKYCSYGDSIISLLEVGNGSNNTINKNLIAFDMYQLALDNGWHVAPTCNQDNHKVNFGIANEFRTVILSHNLSDDSIYDALKNMRVYATQDKNLKVNYSINNLPMGSTISQSPKLKFSISAIDSDLKDVIKKIEVLSNNGDIIKSMDFNSNLAKLDFNIKSIENKFYYVKITQSDNKISVTAPIWIE